jgi:hypothetical protein
MLVLLICLLSVAVGQHHTRLAFQVEARSK